MLYVVTIILFLVFYALFCYTYGDDYMSAIRWICFAAMGIALVYPIVKVSLLLEISPIWACIFFMVLYIVLYFLGGFINERIPMDLTIRRNGNFIFAEDVLQDDDKRWNIAYYRNPTKFRDGIVYVHPSKWSFRRIVIARYRYDDIYSLRSVVEDAKTRKQIGAVIPSFYQFIYLSRKNEAFLRQGADKHLDDKECPEQSKIVAAFSHESGSGKIVDAETDRVLGYYDCGGIGAAAAFIALTSTFHTQTEYANYQVDWEFED